MDLTREQIIERRDLLLRKKELLAIRERQVLPSSEQMFNSPEGWRNNMAALNVPNRMLLESAAKKVQASKYLSELGGIPQELVFDNYEPLSKALKHSGNHEADWEVISGHYQQINKIKDARTELAKSGIRVNGNTVEMFPVEQPENLAPERFGELFKTVSAASKKEELQVAMSHAEDERGFLEALKQGGIPIVDLPKELQELRGTLELAKAFEENPETLDHTQLLRLTQNITELQRKNTLGGMIGTMLSDMPDFAAAFYASGPAGAVAKAGLRKSVKALVSKGLQEKLKKHMLTRGIAKVGEVAVIGAAKTPIAGAPVGSKDFINRITPDLGLTKDEKEEFKMLVTGEGKDIPTAFKESVLDSYIEVTSEMTGGALAPLGAKTKQLLMKSALIRSLVNANPSKKLSQVSKVVKQFGYNGTLGEMFEERLGEVARGITGLEDWKLPTAQQLVAEMVAFSVPGLGIKAGEFLLNKSNPGMPGVPNAKEWPLILEHFTEKQIKEVYGEVGWQAANGNPEAQQQYIDDLMGKVLTENEKPQEEPLKLPEPTAEKIIPVEKPTTLEEEASGTVTEVEQEEPKVISIPQKTLGTARDQTPVKKNYVKLTQAEIDNIRERFNFAALDSPTRQRWEEVLNQAKAEGLEENSFALAISIIANPRTLSAKEHAGMVIRQAMLEKNFEEVSRRVTEQYDLGNIREAQELVNISNNLYDEIETITMASQMAGTEAGRALAARRIAVDKNTFKLVNLINKATATKKGSLTAEEKAKLQKLADQIEEQQIKIAALEADLDKAAEAEAEAKANEAIREFKSVRGKRKIESAREERKALKGELLKLGFQVNDITNTIGMSVEIAHILSRIAVTHIEEGAETLAEVVRRVQQDVPEASNRDIYNSLGGRIRAEKNRVESEVKARIKELKTQAKLEGQILDALKGQFDTPAARKEASKRVKELREQLAKLKQFAYKNIKDDAQLKKIVLKINEVQDALSGNIAELAKPTKPKRMDRADVAAAKLELKELREELAKRKRLQKQIETLEAKLEGTYEPKEIPDAKEESPEVNKLRDEIEELQIELDKTKEKSPLTEDNKQTNRLFSLQKRISQIEHNLETGTRPIKRSQTKNWRPDVVEAANKYNELKRLMDTLDAITDLEEQLRTGNFKISAPRERIVKSAQLEEALVKKQQLQREIRGTITDMAPRTAWGTVKEFLYLSRLAQATADMSYAFRQGIILAPHHPIIATHAFAKAFKAMFSTYTADSIMLAIKSHSNQLERDKAKLFISSLDKGIHHTEELFVSRLGDHIPVFRVISRASERHMTTGLNLLRVGVFDAFLKNHPEATQEQKTAYAHFINLATGRGDLGRFGQAGQHLAAIFFSPRFAISRIQAPWQLVKRGQDPLVRKEIAKDFFYFAMTGFTVMALAYMAGADVDFDPESSDFGKIVIGNRRIDIWGGLLQPARLLSLALAKGLDTYGVREMDKDVNLWDAGARFIEYKTSPAVSIPMTLLTGKTITNKEQGLAETAIRSYAPFVLQESYDTWQQTESPTAVLSNATMTFLGIGVQEYDND